MVYSYVYDNLLKVSRNRASYEKLWTISKYRGSLKFGDKKKIESINIGIICESLLADVIDGDESAERPRKNFYIAVQLAIGAVKVFKWQIDSLFDKSQAAMVTYSYKLAEIEQLSQKSRKLNSKTPVKRVYSLAQAETEMKPNMYDKMELEFFDPKSNKKNKNADLTLVKNSKSITMTDDTPKFTLDNFERRHELNNFEDFEEATQEELNGLLDILQNNGKTVRQVPSMNGDLEIDELRTNQSQKRSIEEEYLNIFNKRQCIYDNESNNISFLNTIENQQSLSLPMEVEIPENIQDTLQEQTIITYEVQEPRNFTPLTENESNMSSFNDSSIKTDLPKIKNVQKTIKKKVNKKLVIDKITRIPLDTLKRNSYEYENLMILLPTLDFRYRMVEVKSHFQKLLATPLRSKINKGLMELYTNNLVKVSNTKPKKQTVAKTNPPKESTRSVQSIKVPEDPMLTFNLENEKISMFEPMVIDDPIFPVFETENIIPVEETDDGYNFFVSRQIKAETYHEKDRWTSAMVFNRLTDLWKQNSGLISMQKICNGKCSRFVRAGIFYKLMNLEKLRKISLIQIQGSLEIYDIVDSRE